jgi:imidazolonepropionase
MASRRSTQQSSRARGRPQPTAGATAFSVREEYGPARNQPLVLLRRISQLVTMCPEQPSEHAELRGPRRGSRMREIGLLKDASVLISGERIAAVGTSREVERNPLLREHRAWVHSNVMELDCRGLLVLPGFVDSHTHPVFLSPRLCDFERRVAGATYEEIAAAGGGIRSSIAEVRRASEAKLAEQVHRALRQAESQGTTTLEAKSGYGLDAASEIKSLRAIRRAAEQWDGTVLPTFLGAHAVPPEFEGKPQRYVDLLCRELLPAVARRKLAQFVDVYCERGAFNLAQSERILREAEHCNLRTRLHAGQWTRTPLASLLRFHPASIDHLDRIERDDVGALAASETVATLLPGANYFLGTKSYPPGRRLIDAGAAVALATDYNPGSSPTLSMPMVLSLACTQMRMTVEEALTAATINGAWALDLGGRKGSIEPGKDADLAFFALDDYRELPYWFGANHSVAAMMRGRLAEPF